MKKFVLLMALVLLVTLPGCSKVDAGKATEPVTQAPTEPDAPVPAYPDFTEAVNLADQEDRYRINIS